MHALIATLLLVPAPASYAEVTGDVGLVAGDGFGGLLLGGSFLARTSVVGGGATVEASGLFSSRVSAAALGGLSYRGENGFGLDLLGVFGMHHYERVGSGLLSNDPGVSGTLPFAGGRSRLSYQFGRRFADPSKAGRERREFRRFQLGASAAFENDLTRERHVSYYTETSWLGGENYATSSTHKIGFQTVSPTLDLGVAYL